MLVLPAANSERILRRAPVLLGFLQFMALFGPPFLIGLTNPDRGSGELLKQALDAFTKVSTGKGRED
jgi:hypothetical protein